MEKTYKRVPFEIELAKKIQSGEIEGRIIARNNDKVRILCFDKFDGSPFSFNIVALVGKGDNVRIYSTKGVDSISYEGNDLFIELPEEKYKFKPFDKVLVRDSPAWEWKVDLFSAHHPEKEQGAYVCVGGEFEYCIPYEGNEHLVGKIK